MSLWLWIARRRPICGTKASDGNSRVIMWSPRMRERTRILGTRGQRRCSRLHVSRRKRPRIAT